ncbi:hypothetical protein OZX58_04795 [Lactobacillus sp. ESL0680]|uniref:hypothetical protein n=1 Tax=Lactobacillus sp. ESL0680 TaxID=2983210 RepID=UPI0023F92FD9|nr:hypothetical protein [Lactobacillus sp. ESL0680]WEV38067.1 hypothetical protein OZX58_04795 [Lactobacillus sp. ESL0680]
MLSIKEAKQIIDNFANSNNNTQALTTKRSFFTTKKIANQIAFPNQKQHWLDYLTKIEQKDGPEKDFKYAYNHVHCAPMLCYLANQLNIKTEKAEKDITDQHLQMMSEAKKFRDNYLPYADVEVAMSRLIKN